MKNILKTAENLLKDRMSVEKVCRMTGLTKEEVENLTI